MNSLVGLAGSLGYLILEGLTNSMFLGHSRCVSVHPLDCSELNSIDPWETTTFHIGLSA